MLTLEDLAPASRLVGGPGIWDVRQALRLLDGRSESPGETRLGHAVTLMGFAATPQVPVEDGAVAARVDLLLDGAHVVLEFDEFLKYARTRPLTLQQAPADVVLAEKVREDHIRSLGYEVVRVIWSDLDDLPALRRRIDAAIARARTRKAA